MSKAKESAIKRKHITVTRMSKSEKAMKKSSMRLIGFTILLLTISVNSLAGECTEKFSWLPNHDTDTANVKGYRIYYGTTDLGPYPMVIDITDTSTIDGRIHGSVAGLECGIRYHFVCVAYNDTGESNHSLQVTTIAGQSGFPWVLLVPVFVNPQN